MPARGVHCRGGTSFRCGEIGEAHLLGVLPGLRPGEVDGAELPLRQKIGLRGARPRSALFLGLALGHGPRFRGLGGLAGADGVT